MTAKHSYRFPLHMDFFLIMCAVYLNPGVYPPGGKWATPSVSVRKYNKF